MPLAPRGSMRSAAWRFYDVPAFSHRASLVPGNYRPDATNTGAIVSTLTTHSGNFTTSSHNQVVDSLDITGHTKIRHDNVTFTNCRFQGGTNFGSSFGSVEAWQTRLSPTKFYDCTFIATPQNVYNTNSIQGESFELYRCDLSGSVDGVGADTTHVWIYACWIHDQQWYASDPAQGGGESHNDGVQIHGGSDFRVVGCSIEMGTSHNACIMVKDDVASLSNILIDKNWLISNGASQCAVGLNIYTTNAATSTTITNNKFSALSTWESNHAGLIRANTYDALTALSGNVYLGTSDAAKITRDNS